MQRNLLLAENPATIAGGDSQRTTRQCKRTWRERWYRILSMLLRQIDHTAGLRLFKMPPDNQIHHNST